MFIWCFIVACFLWLFHCLPLSIPMFVFCFPSCFVPSILIDCPGTKWTLITNSRAANQRWPRGTCQRHKTAQVWKAERRRKKKQEQKGRETNKKQKRGKKRTGEKRMTRKKRKEEKNAGTGEDGTRKGVRVDGTSRDDTSPWRAEATEPDEQKRQDATQKATSGRRRWPDDNRSTQTVRRAWLCQCGEYRLPVNVTFNYFAWVSGHHKKGGVGREAVCASVCVSSVSKSSCAHRHSFN